MWKWFKLNLTLNFKKIIECLCYHQFLIHLFSKFLGRLEVAKPCHFHKYLFKIIMQELLALRNTPLQLRFISFVGFHFDTLVHLQSSSTKMLVVIIKRRPQLMLRFYSLRYFSKKRLINDSFCRFQNKLILRNIISFYFLFYEKHLLS